MFRIAVNFKVITQRLIIMSSHKTLSSFFKYVPKRNPKRFLDPQPADNSEPSTKKLQNDSEGKDSPSTTIAAPKEIEKPETTCISPEQKESGEPSETKDKAKIIAEKFSALSSNIGDSWFLSLESEFSKEYFQKLSSFLEEEREKNTVFPPVDDVYSWTLACDIKEVKVVILGQDPYHGVNQAHGLAFSVRKGVATPPSLVNMYKELAVDIPGFEIPAHGCLQGWADQGVLLLNAVLTVRSGNANSHKDKGWENLTDAVIRYLNEHLTGVVFLLWGSYAQKKGAFINKERHLVLNSPHPSPLSAHKGFFGCKHFSKANDYLVEQGKNPIDWKSLP